MSPSYMRLALRHGRIKYPAFTNKDIDELEADLEKQPCHGCAAGKAKRRPHGGTHEDDVETRNDVMVFEDEYGPEATKTHRGYTKFAAFRTRRSRWGFVYLMKTQSDIYDVFHQFFDDYYRKFGELPTMILMDNDPTHKSDEMDRLLRKRGVTAKFTVPHCGEQNPAEVYIRTISTVARTHLAHSGLPKPFWGYSVLWACYLCNRLITDGNPDMKSPWEMEHGEPPLLDHLRPFGSVVYSALPHDGREQARAEGLDAAAEVGVLVGCSEQHRGYLVFFPRRGRNGSGNVLVRRHLRFWPPGTAPPQVDDATFREQRRAIAQQPPPAPVGAAVPPLPAPVGAQPRPVHKSKAERKAAKKAAKALRKAKAHAKLVEQEAASAPSCSLHSL